MGTKAFFAREKTPAPPIRRVRVARRPGETHRGVALVGAVLLPCALGRSGIGRFKREGDGVTPAGRLLLLEGFWRADHRLPPRCLLRLRPIAADAGWSDDPADGRYNRPVRLPFAGSHESLRRDDALYDVVLVLDWNVRRRALGRGSAIFLHLARDGFAPTAGCVAFAPRDLARLLPRLGRHAALVVV
jgi:L,D-peptidoglycan transpeptidase YkuD (ErfK/YbiS/YcfS/YnhG family)